MASETKKRKIDWESIEKEYRANQLSVRDIATKHGVSHTIINRKAAKNEWKRDLSEAVNSEIKNRLIESDVSRKVSNGNTREVIDAAATRGVEVVKTHRKNIQRVAGLLAKISDGLDAHLDGVMPMEDNPIFASKGDGVGTLTQALSNSLKTLITLERQAYNLDSKESDAKGDTGDAVIHAFKLRRG